MTEPKTRPTAASVADFIAAVPDARRRAEASALCALMAEETGAPPVLWGPSIVGFGRYVARYASGRTTEWMLTGFSPRSSALVVYVVAGFAAYRDLLARLGPHRTGASCLYLKRLADVDEGVLRTLVRDGAAAVRAAHAATA